MKTFFIVFTLVISVSLLTVFDVGKPGTESIVGFTASVDAPALMQADTVNTAVNTLGFLILSLIVLAAVSLIAARRKVLNADSGENQTTTGFVGKHEVGWPSLA